MLPPDAQRRRTLGAFPPPLWGRAREGVFARVSETPPLTPPHKGEGNILPVLLYGAQP